MIGTAASPSTALSAKFISMNVNNIATISQPRTVPLATFIWTLPVILVAGPYLVVGSL